MSTIILRAMTRVLTPAIVAVSIYLLLRGHNSPGGGFIAALVAGAAVFLRYLAEGSEGARRFLPVGFRALVGAGLALAVGSGIAGLLLGGDFLESTILAATVPVAGEVKVATSLVFDIGVYLVVISVIVAIIESLGEGEEA